ncbi:MAG: division/cell wall cluster transcriptional repressor MraZ [Nitrospirota bacterium]|nr:division/cell wall cluster transcriptional repressor MraZ [Nitrospirota bacterium]
MVGNFGEDWGQLFLGRESNRMDAKGRLAIPAKFREVVGQGARLVVTRKVLDPCLEVYSEERWKAFMDQLQALSQVKPEARQYRRLIYSGAEVCSLDRQGRILIPAHLRDYAALGREAVLVGNGDTFEIWDESRWQEEMARVTDPTGLADALADLGL